MTNGWTANRKVATAAALSVTNLRTSTEKQQIADRVAMMESIRAKKTDSLIDRQTLNKRKYNGACFSFAKTVSIVARRPLLVVNSEDASSDQTFKVYA